MFIPLIHFSNLFNTIYFITIGKYIGYTIFQKLGVSKILNVFESQLQNKVNQYLIVVKYY